MLAISTFTSTAGGKQVPERCAFALGLRGRPEEEEEGNGWGGGGMLRKMNESEQKATSQAAAFLSIPTYGTPSTGQRAPIHLPPHPRYLNRW